MCIKSYHGEFVFSKNLHKPWTLDHWIAINYQERQLNIKLPEDGKILTKIFIGDETGIL